ncbi:fasciculation and elongation protein zeta-2 isoform X4 [Rhineura floridana]|uniref:fasciculation and elongation protein zeta-2 isoform X4 n=1 Tax=Rhineura floridana TaxID=261503 RepID=UPI002AC8726B|nr:fasciculation and elongation protein zeta-2 isoform X4 [Rhineura floridana]
MAAATAASQRDPSGDWQDFSGFQPSAEESGSPESSAAREGGSRSNEGDGNDLAAKLPLCFQPPPRSCGDGEAHIPPRPLSEQSALHEDEIWNALTDNYGNVMPVDWKSSHTRILHLPTLNLSEMGVNDNMNLDLSDDEELREQLDMHSIIVSCINEEPLFTAEQVIEEIEEMMQESPDPDDDETPTQSDRLSILSQEIQTLKRSSTNHNYEERVKKLSVTELNDLLEEIETAIKDYSEELVQQLALRDELEFEKEVKNSFISALIEVQNKQREQKEMTKKKKKMKNGSPQNSKQERGHMPGTYLTTVIPYEKKSGPPSVEDLQTLTKILHAMKEDSEKVPSLLTDYILKAAVHWVDIFIKLSTTILRSHSWSVTASTNPLSIYMNLGVVFSIALILCPT